jgi:hypothetical protein
MASFRLMFDASDRHGFRLTREDLGLDGADAK